MRNGPLDEVREVGAHGDVVLEGAELVGEVFGEEGGLGIGALDLCRG